MAPATLRKWERAGILVPRRDPSTGHRHYSADDVRDAELAHLLRRGGYPLNHIATVIGHVRSAGGTEPLAASLADWHQRLASRGRAMLTAAPGGSPITYSCWTARPSFIRAREALGAGWKLPCVQ